MEQGLMAQAPAVHTDKKPEDPVKDGSNFSDASPKSELENMMKILDQKERTSGPSGAVPMLPKQRLLDARDLEAKHPEARFRWINLKNDQKVQARQLQGYIRVPTAEGGRQVGDLALFACPRRVFEERVAELKRRNKERLNAHRTEVENMAEAVAKELRDKHGIRVNAERILIAE